MGGKERKGNNCRIKANNESRLNAKEIQGWVEGLSLRPCNVISMLFFSQDKLLQLVILLGII